MHGCNLWSTLVDRDGRDDRIRRDVGHDGYISIWLLDGVRFIGDDQF